MSIIRLSKAALLAGVCVFPWTITAHAADLILSPEPISDTNVDWVAPAVSGVNGKIEFDGGLLNAPGMTGVFRIGGSLSAPLGDRFGLQLDAGLQTSGAGTLLSGAAHLFTRDPSSYLIGVTAGVVRGPAGVLGAIGAEGELYLDRVSLEGWAGLAALNYDDPLLADLSGVFVIGDLAYYPTDDWRLSVGGSHLLGYNSLHLGTEYQFRELSVPFSGTGDFRYGQDGAWKATIGIKGYFGGDSGKSLIDRHRQDDPPNRALDLFAAASLLSVVATPPLSEEDQCIADGGTWDPEFSWDSDLESWVAGCEMDE